MGLKLKTLSVRLDGKLKPFEVVLNKGSSILEFIDKTGDTTVKLVVLEAPVENDEIDRRRLCFYQADDKEVEVPYGAVYIAMSKGTYWSPFMLFDITHCATSELDE